MSITSVSFPEAPRAAVFAMKSLQVLARGLNSAKISVLSFFGFPPMKVKKPAKVDALSKKRVNLKRELRGDLIVELNQLAPLRPRSTTRT